MLAGSPLMSWQQQPGPWAHASTAWEGWPMASHFGTNISTCPNMAGGARHPSCAAEGPRLHSYASSSHSVEAHKLTNKPNTQIQQWQEEPGMGAALIMALEATPCSPTQFQTQPAHPKLAGGAGHPSSSAQGPLEANQAAPRPPTCALCLPLSTHARRMCYHCRHGRRSRASGLHGSRLSRRTTRRAAAGRGGAPRSGARSRRACAAAASRWVPPCTAAQYFLGWALAMPRSSFWGVGFGGLGQGAGGLGGQLCMHAHIPPLMPSLFRMPLLVSRVCTKRAARPCCR